MVMSSQRLGAVAVLAALVVAGCSGKPEALIGTQSPQPKSSVATVPDPVLNPLAIDAMRQRDYPGSDLTIEQTLPPGGNYQRYIASYRSDGLQLFGLLTVPNGP